MLIKSVLLQALNLKIIDPNPQKNMHVDIDKKYLMPSSIQQNVFNCIIEINLVIIGQDNRELVAIKLSYLLIVDSLGEEYTQEISEKIYNSLQSLFIQKVNDLLKETNFPPISLNIEAKM